MEFSSDSSTQSGTGLETLNAQRAKYAADPEDNAFVHCLIQCTKHHVLRDRLDDEAKSERNFLLLARSAVEDLRIRTQRYIACDEPYLQSLITAKTDELDAYAKELLIREQVSRGVDARLRELASKRRKDVADLYGRVPRYLTRRMTGKSTIPGVVVNYGCCKALSHIAARAERVRQGEVDLSQLRRSLIDIDSRMTSARGRANGDDDVARLKTQRRDACLRYKQQEVEVSEMQQNQLDAEKDFFLNLVYNMLNEANILTGLQATNADSADEDLSSVERTDSPTAVKSKTLIEEQAQPPELRALLEKRAVAAKLVDKLEALRSKYTQALADYLVTYPGSTRARFDASYSRNYTRQSFRSREAEALEAVQKAEEECDDARQIAEEAGVLELPPSPLDLGGRSEDGLVSSEGSSELARERISARKTAPAIKRWAAKVARSGSPIEPSLSSRQPTGGRSKRPRGQIQPSWPWEDGVAAKDATASRSRIARYDRHQQQMRRRAQRQEAERVKARGKSTRSCTIL